MNIELDDSTVSAVQFDVNTAYSNSTNAQDEKFNSNETKKATNEKLKTFIAYTQIESSKHVAKKFWLTTDGKLEQKTAASVHTGQMKVVHCADVFAFAESLTNLSTHQCLVFGVPPRDAFLTTKEDWVKRGCPDDPLPRSKEVMSWSNGPGVLLLDYDAPKNGDAPLERDELLALLFKACTKADGKDIIWWPSTSSLIYAGDKQMRGLRGQRIYIIVKDAADIPRAGKTLNDRLWSMGVGRFEVSASGSLLERSLFDGSVWQTNRIDFAAGAHCGEGLEQRRGAPEVLDTFPGGLLDTATALPDLTNVEIKAAHDAKNVARQAVAEEAQIARKLWIEAKADDIVRADPKVPRDTAIKTVTRAAERSELMGDWLVTVKDKNGNCLEVTVAEILDSPENYHGLLTLDPLEPEYDGGRFVGKLFLFSARPSLFSFAHGGVKFRLSRQPQRIEMVKGKTSETTDATLEVLRRAPDVFDFGAELVIVDGGAVHTLNEHSLRYELGRMTQYWGWRKISGGGAIEELHDPSDKVSRSILSMGGRRKLKKLDAVVTVPTLRRDGSVLDAPGFDAPSRLLYDSDEDSIGVPFKPTRQQAFDALEFLWSPFETFPFCTGLDRAVHLSALITAAVRPSLPTSPAFGYDAPVQGSGKTLLARCIGMLTEGKDPAVWPHTAGRDDEEVRKRLFTALRAGARCVVWDNVVGQFDSAALAACLTSPVYQDRILGQSLSSTVPNRAVFTLTGNNLQLAGDLPRRVLVARIDPQTDRPFARSFKLDPLAHCRAHRQRMIASALTLVRATLTEGCAHPGEGAMASFENWDAWVRQTVIYANEVSGGKFGDVMEVVMSNQATDPEQESLKALLEAWTTEFGSTGVTTAEVLKRCDSYNNTALRDALDEFAHGKLTAKSVGRMLRYRVGRICGGRRLEDRGENSSGSRVWRVVVMPKNGDNRV